MSENNNCPNAHPEKSTLKSIKVWTQIKVIFCRAVIEQKVNRILFWKSPESGRWVFTSPSWDALGSGAAGWSRPDWPPASSRRRPAAPFVPAWRCPWTRCACRGPSSWSRCCASFWRWVWTWRLCWVPPGSQPSGSPCLCGSPAPRPRLGTRPRRLGGAASPPSPQVHLHLPAVFSLL